MTVHPSFCRTCHNACPVDVTVEDGRVVSMQGIRDNPIYHGYTCIKGRATSREMYHPERLLQSQRRMESGTFEDIGSERLLDEISHRLQQIMEEHGPDSIAIYTGTKAYAHPTTGVLTKSFVEAIGSRMWFTSDTIDQPGKHVAKALHGMWLGGSQLTGEPNAGLVVGANPLISLAAGAPIGNPGRWLQEQRDRGMDLIVIDPRRTETAHRATIHLQARPGQDAAILAAMLRVILTEGLHDEGFLSAEATGLENLRAAVEGYRSDDVAAQADIDVADLERAARILAGAQRGFALGSTGANMSGFGTLVEYLLLCTNTVCGFWCRAGELIAAPLTLMPPMPVKAQATGTFPAYDLGEPLPATGLRASVAGMPTGALAQEILHPGRDRVRALISVGGNPVAVWPDQLTTIRAMEALELLVQVDIRMSPTARFADYVVAPTMPFEMPSHTATQELIALYGSPWSGLPAPWAQWTDAVVEPPPGSDLIAEWEMFFGIGQRLGLQLSVGAVFGFMDMPPVPLIMSEKPTTEDLLGLIAGRARVGIEEIKRHPHGALFPDTRAVVEPKDPDCDSKLDVGNADMMSDLARMSDHEGKECDPNFAFRLICRRMPHVFNSSSHAALGGTRRYNPAFMNPADLAELGMADGDTAAISSSSGSIAAIVRADSTLRRGLVSMAHAFGDVPEKDHQVREIGSSSNRLIPVGDRFQAYTGQPWMSNVPVAMRPHSSTGETPEAG